MRQSAGRKSRMENREGKGTVSVFEHENALWHYGNVNKRSLYALIAVCFTFLLITVTFVVGYTIREKNWLDTIAQMQRPVTEVAADDSVHKQPNP